MRMMTLLVVLATSISALANLSSDYVGDNLEIQACDTSFKNQNVYFRIGKNGIAQAEKANLAGCAKKIYRKSVLPSEREISVYYGVTENASDFAVINLRTGKSGSGPTPAPTATPRPSPTPNPTSTPQPTPTPSTTPAPGITPTPVPTATPVPEAKRKEINRRSEEAARRFANQFVSIYGQVEKVRINLSRGIRLQQSISGLNESNPERSQQFNAGSGRGDQDGFSRGQTAGDVEVNRVASANGDAQAVQAFRAVVDKGVNPNLQIDYTAPVIQVPNTESPAVDSLSSQVRRRVEQIADQLRTYLYINDDVVVYDSYNEFNRNYGQTDWLSQRDDDWIKYELLLAADRYDQAWLQWLNEELTTANRDLLRYYRDLQPGAEQQIFRTNFKNIYDDVITQKWNRKVQERDASIEALGQMVFLSAFDNYAHQAGYRAGFDEGFPEGVRRGSEGKYNAALERAFTARATYLQTHAAIEIHQISILTSEELEKKTAIQNITIGDVLNVFVQKGENYGMQPGALSAAIATDSLFRGTTVGIGTAEPLASIKPVLASNAGMMIGMADADQSVSVRAQVGSLSVARSFVFSWERTLAQLGKSKDTAIQAQIEAWLPKVLLKEWDKEKKIVGKSVYEKDAYKTLLGRLVLELKSLKSANEVSMPAYRTALASLRKAFDKEKPGFASPYKAEYKIVQDLLKQADSAL